MKIGIIGLGLIGGSVFKDLKALGYDVIAVSKSRQGEGIFKNYDVLKNCDVVFVCTPMNNTLAVLDELETVLPETAIVTDVCSLKEFVCTKKRPYRFIPSHPMAGTENKGFESSFEGLFKGAKWVILEDNAELAEIIKALGAKPVFMSAKEHDEAAAMISHMPMVIAQALFLAASENPLALEIAASGFRDMTRLALSNEEMAADLVNMNAENIQTAILKLYAATGKLMTNDYPELISEIKTKRGQMFKT
ncbi:MAG: prephenate dehydrogenase/arogenate dehydrogenase family protein [Heliobacteriaceae bacterium]|jgi:arogenate dehydrogenase (NADP+)|nr:prephenate dehydrogenase/arogenate dehydrogenase family protein [Heliobacteriaceae bacterium]